MSASTATSADVDPAATFASTINATSNDANAAQSSHQPSYSYDSSVLDSSDSPSKRVDSPNRTSFHLHKQGRSHSSSNVLKRLTSRSSSFGATAPSHSSVHTQEPDSPTKPKLDRSALEKQRGKYKSSVNWNNPDFQVAQSAEPFMEQATPYEKEQEELRLAQAQEIDLREMAAAGGTKAALAKAKLNSIGDPIFLSSQRVVQEQAKNAAAQQQQFNDRRQSMMLRSTIYNGINGGSNGGINGGSNGGINGGSNGGSNGVVNGVVNGTPSPSNEQPPESQTFTESGQKALFYARQATAASSDALAQSAPVEDATEDATTKKDDKLEKTVKRRTFLGFGRNSGAKDKGKDKSKAQKAVANKATEQQEQQAHEPAVEAASQEPVPSENEANPRQPYKLPSQSPLGKSEPADASTLNRRRRFNDTRELEFVASQLAAESMIDKQETYLPTAEARRASMMGVLAASHPPSVNHEGAAYANGLNMPYPSFMADSRAASSTNSPVNGSPHLSGTDVSRFEAPRAPFARSLYSNSQPSSPHLPQKSKLTGLPTDMLTGLGDGPYPSLPPRGLDLSDPSGIPIFPDYGSDTSRTHGRSSLPGFAPRSRVASASSNATWAGTQPGAHSSRRSVLQMSMHNPESELQGLTKLPKSSRGTPFASQANSRQVTPHASSTALTDKFREDGRKTSKPSSPPSAAAKALSSQDDAERTGPKASRMSIFGKWNKSTSSLTAKDSKPQLKPPVPIATSQTPQSGTSASSDSMQSRPTSRTSDDVHGRMDSMTHGLQKVSSPSSASASSHDRSAGSSEMDASNNATSTVTTPDVPATHIDFSIPKNATTSTDSTSTPTVTSAPQVSLPIYPSATPIFDALAKSTESHIDGAETIKPMEPKLSPSPQVSDASNATTKEQHTAAATNAQGASNDSNTTKTAVPKASPSVKSNTTSKTKPSKTSQGNRMARFMSFMGTKKNTSDNSPKKSAKATPAIKQPANGKPVEKAESPASPDLTLGTQKWTIEPDPAVPAQTSGSKFSELVTHGVPQESVRVEPAYVNADMADMRYGTKSAYQAFIAAGDQTPPKVPLAT